MWASPSDKVLRLTVCNCLKSIKINDMLLKQLIKF